MKKYLYIINLLIILLYGCSSSEGPVDIKWDRDTCERCKMVVSDRYFAAQISIDKKHYMFDDLGCAIHWLQTQPVAENSNTRIWVTDHRTGKWLDALQSYYIAEKITPMDYGFGAVAGKEMGSVDFQTAKLRILATKPHQHHKQH